METITMTADTWNELQAECAALVWRVIGGAL